MTASTGVLFRVDASPKVGLGHLRRCLTLADHLRNAGCKVLLVCGDQLTPEVAPLAATHTVYSLDKGSRIPAGGIHNDELWDADATLSLIGHNKAELTWVVVDSYQLGHRWERSMCDAGFRVMVIDDFRDRMHHADLLVSDLDVPFDPALNARRKRAGTLAGREYALIGPEYAYVRAPDSQRARPRRLLVSYGGSDPTGETMKALLAIRLVKERPATSALLGRVDVVAGQLNPLAGRISQTAGKIQDVVIRIAPPTLATLMRAADLVLTAGGNSMLEALALRKPCLVTVTADNQKLMVSQLAAENMIRSLGAQRAVKPEDIEEGIVDILTGYEKFSGHVASRRTFDHLGAQRIAAAMLNWQAVPAR